MQCPVSTLSVSKKKWMIVSWHQFVQLKSLNVKYKIEGFTVTSPVYASRLRPAPGGWPQVALVAATGVRSSACVGADWPKGGTW